MHVECKRMHTGSSRANHKYYLSGSDMYMYHLAFELQTRTVATQHMVMSALPQRKGSLDLLNPV